MQQNTPDKDRPEANVPLSKAAPIGEPYTNEEWNVLAETPVKICRAVMAVSPSGPVGATKEILAMRNSMKEALQGVKSPTLQNLNKSLQKQETAEALWKSAEYAFRDRWDAANVRQIAITTAQQTVALLKKVPAQDAQAYKEFVYATALKVAEASKEGGAMGMRGQAISEAEQSLLNDVAKALELPQAH